MWEPQLSGTLRDSTGIDLPFLYRTENIFTLGNTYVEFLDVVNNYEFWKPDPTPWS
jgi:hypothetical protein